MYGPGQRHLERPRRPADGRPVLGDDPQAVGRRDRFEDLEPVLLVVPAGAEPAGRRQRPDAGQVAVELGGEEARPAHLAVGDDVDAGRFLVADRDVDRVVEHLREVDRPELPALRRGQAGHEPGRPGVRPDDAREQAAGPVRGTDGLGHAVLPVMLAGVVSARPAAGGRRAKANARAGLSTKTARQTSASEAALGHGPAEPVEQVHQAGRRHRTRGSSPGARRPCPSTTRSVWPRVRHRLEQLERAVGPVAPAEALVVLGERTGRDDLA